MRILYKKDNLQVVLYTDGRLIFQNRHTGHKVEVKGEGKTVRVTPDVAYLGIHPELEHSYQLS